MVYSDIDHLPIWNYHKIKDSGDFSYLSSDEQPVDESFSNIWENIVSQYILATSHRFENRMYAHINRVILELTIKRDAIFTFCFVLENDFSNKLARKELSKLGYMVKNKKDIAKVKRRAKNFNTQIREKQAEINKEFADKGSSMSFEGLVDRVSDHKKRQLNPKEISVRAWIAIEDNYLKDIQNASN